MKVLGVVLVCLVFAPAAQAAYPGTHEEPRLESAASVAAGKPVRVFCGDSPEAWSALVVSLGGPPTADGFSDKVGGTEAYLAPSVCEPLVTPGTSPEEMGRAILTLDHEATHLSGMSDEGATDCAALAKVRLTAFFSFKVRRKYLARVYASALAGHRNKPPAYQGNC